MYKILKFIFWFVLGLMMAIFIYLASIISWASVTNYQPEKITEPEVNGAGIKETVDDSVLTFLTWNIGYCGLGAEMDFFYDGGQKVRPGAEEVKKYTSGVLNYLKSADSIDFILLQEVDKNSARTGNQDETQLIQHQLCSYSSVFGANYKVRFVPLPFTNPLGRVEMGQMNLSKYHPVTSQRYSYQSAYSWPKNLFMLDRCFVVSRFNLKNGYDLVVLNTHNSAYDTSGKLRKKEMPVIRDLMLAEFEKGHYVIAGGDWNQNPPGFDLSELTTKYQPVRREMLNDFLFPDEWNIVYDPSNPTNRDVDIPLTEGKSGVTIIDYFIVSPNIQVKEIQPFSQGFRHSDHEPVFLKLQLK